MSWAEITIGQLVDIKHGFAFKGEHFSNSGRYVVLTPGNCENSGGFKSRGDREKWYSSDIPEGYILNEGDLLVVMTDLVNTAPVLGGCFIIPESDKYLHNQRLGLIHVLNEKKVSKNFLYYLFNTYTYRSQIRGSASGATVRHTSPARIKDCIVKIPQNRAEQQRISSILSTYDALIENNRRRIFLLEEAARQLYKEWFVRFRFPGHEHVKIVDGLPQGWRNENLFVLATATYGYAFKSELFNEDKVGRPVVRIRDVPDRKSGTWTTEEAPSDKILENGDFLVGMDGDFHMNFWAGGTAWLNQRVVRLAGNSRFATGLLRNAIEQQIKDLNETITGTTVKHLGAKHLNKICLVVPNDVLLDQANEFFENVRNMVVSLSVANEQLAKARDLLLPKLMNGTLAV